VQSTNRDKNLTDANDGVEFATKLEENDSEKKKKLYVLNAKRQGLIRTNTPENIEIQTFLEEQRNLNKKSCNMADNLKQRNL